LVLLPGADAHQAAILAEDLRQTISGSHHGGLPVTMSFGVSASPPSSFDYDRVFAAADHALYAAKAAGRNCVRIDGAADVSSPPLQAPQSPQLEPALSG
jgi:diguanylate cyclase (GGDEF)-like protein